MIAHTNLNHSIQKFGRSSIETVLHCLLDHRFTLHVHANPLALLVREDAKPELAND